LLLDHCPLHWEAEIMTTRVSLTTLLDRLARRVIGTIEFATRLAELLLAVFMLRFFWKLSIMFFAELPGAK
jgi:hypothetical protein